MLKQRISSSIIIITGIICALFFDWVFAAAVLFFVIGGLYEFFTMLEKKEIRIYKYVGIAIGVVIPASILFRFEPTKTWELFFMVLTLLVLIIMQFRRRENQGVIVGISTTLFGILYVSWFFSFVIKIRNLPNGVFLLAGILLITKMGDIGAYLIGSRFGKRPLMPRISPKKSVEGAVGGLIFSVVAALAVKPLVHFSFLHLAAIGLTGGILGQLGDLSESLMKRDCQVKDSGNLVPGMGGILDLIDSILFTAPVYYFYLSVIVR